MSDAKKSDPKVNVANGYERLGGLDIRTIATSQQKNIAAAAHANLLAMEAAQEALRHQTKIAQAAAEELSSLWTGLSRLNIAPGERLSRHAECTRRILDKGLGHFHEIANVAAKVNGDIIDIVSRRMADQLSEWPDRLPKQARL